MTIRLHLLLFSLCIICSSSVFGQESWSLERCIRYAVENNINIQQTELATRSSKLNYDNAVGAKYPNLNFNLSHNYNFGGAIDPTTYEFTSQRIRTNSANLGSSWIVYQGGQIRNQIDRSRLDLRSAELDREQTINDITLAISSAYLNILLNKENLNIVENQLRISQSQMQNTQKLINAGILPEGNILDVQAQIANNELNLTTASNALELSILNLKILLDLPATETFNVITPKIEIPSLDYLEALNPLAIYQRALGTQPSIHKADISKLISEKNLQIAEGARLPTISISGGLNTNLNTARQTVDDVTLDGFKEIGVLSSDFTPVLAPNIVPVFSDTPAGTQIRENFTQFIGASLRVPIFNGFQIKNSIAQAKIGMESADLSRRLIENSLMNEIQIAYLDALNAARSYEAAQKSISSIKNSYEFTKKKYDLGVSTALDLQLAENNYSAAELQLRSAKYQYIFKLKVLDFYMGRPIRL